MSDDRLRDFLILNVQVEDIILDVNIRGPLVGDTTELQESIRQRGIEDPLWVRPIAYGKDAEDIDDKGPYYILIDGRRRLTAAKVIGLEEVPCLLKVVDEEEAIDLMLTADMRKKQPPIVLDKEDNVVGGLCWAFYRQVAAGKRMIDITAASGIRADVVGAYVSLHDDLPELRRAIANGRLAITVYSLCKHQEPDFKRYLLTRKSLSARVVRKEIKEWPVTKARLEREAEIEKKLEDVPEEKKAAVRTELEEQGQEPAYEPQPASVLLNKTMVNIRLLVLRDLEPTDIFILQSIHDLVRGKLASSLLGPGMTPEDYDAYIEEAQEKKHGKSK